MIKAIFFDLGNVLILNKSREVYQNWAAKLNIPEESLRGVMKEFNNRRMSGQDMDAEQFLAEEHIQTISADQLKKLQRDIWSSEQPNKELVDFIISNEGKYVFGVISNNFKDAEEVLLNKFNVPKFYTIFVSSHDVKVLKPQKEIYEYAIAQTKFDASECLFIDDSVENVKGAQSCNMQAIQFINNELFLSNLREILN